MLNPVVLITKVTFYSVNSYEGSCILNKFNFLYFLIIISGSGIRSNLTTECVHNQVKII